MPIIRFHSLQTTQRKLASLCNKCIIKRTDKQTKKVTMLPKQRQLVHRLGMRDLERGATLYSKLLFDCQITDARLQSIHIVAPKELRAFQKDSLLEMKQTIWISSGTIWIFK